MLSRTHILISVTGTSFVLETMDPLILTAAAIASLLPDIDTSTSLIGRILKPLSNWFERRFPHRTVTHSLFASLIVSVTILPLRYLNPRLWTAFICGHFLGWFADTFTKSGIAAFYPITSARLVIPANPKLRLATGSRAEYVLQVAVLVLFCFSFQLYEQGGLLRAFNALLGQPEGVAALFVREGATREIIVRINGRFAASLAPIDAEFSLIDVEGEKLLVRDGAHKLYLAGLENGCGDCQIAIHRVVAMPGRVIHTEAREYKFQDEELSAVAGRITPGANADLRIDGELFLKDAHLLAVSKSLQFFNSIEVSGNGEKAQRFRTVRLRAASIEDLRPLLEYFGSGNLLVKEVRIAG